MRTHGFTHGLLSYGLLSKAVNLKSGTVLGKSGTVLGMMILGSTSLISMNAQAGDYISPSVMVIGGSVNDLVKNLNAENTKTYKPRNTITKIVGGKVKTVHLYQANGINFSSDTLMANNVAIRGIKKSTSIKPNSAFGLDIISNSGYGNVEKHLSTWKSDGKNYILQHSNGTLTSFETGDIKGTNTTNLDGRSQKRQVLYVDPNAATNGTSSAMIIESSNGTIGTTKSNHSVNTLTPVQIKAEPKVKVTAAKNVTATKQEAIKPGKSNSLNAVPVKKPITSELRKKESKAKKNNSPYILMDDGSVCFLSNGKIDKCF